MRRIHLSSKLKYFGSLFQDNGFNCYLVGGAVRNIIAGMPPSDYDFTTNATPQEVKKIFRKVIDTGLEHGTVTILFQGEAFEVTTFRTEEGYSDGRHPDKVNFTPDINEDLSRRDFTINAIAANLVNGQIIDPMGGQKDIKNRILKCIGDANLRFEEDGLRILRLFRFQAVMGFAIENKSLKAAHLLKANLKKISQERIKTEFEKIIKSPKPAASLRLMQKQGILAEILPELDYCAGVEQNQFHSWDVFEHSIRSCEWVLASEFNIRLAALFHDIGKPSCKKIIEGQVSFHDHENVGEKMTEKMMKRLKFSNLEIAQTVHLVKQHMFHYTQEWSDKAVRRFIARVGQESLSALFHLRKADRFAHHGEKPSEDDLIELSTRIEKVLLNNEALSIKELKINGNDLMLAGIPKGPVMGIVLNELLEAVMEDPSQNELEKLQTIALNLYNKRIKVHR